MANRKSFFGSHFQFSRWMGYNVLKSNARGIKSLLKELSKVEVSENKESFEQAVARLKLSDDDIISRTMVLLRTSMLYFFFSLCIMGYCIYLFTADDLIGGIMCLPVFSVFSSFCFREHFWYTQMKHRRLGLTVQDWLTCLLKGKLQ